MLLAGVCEVEPEDATAGGWDLELSVWIELWLTDCCEVDSEGMADPVIVFMLVMTRMVSVS